MANIVSVSWGDNLTFGEGDGRLAKPEALDGRLAPPRVRAVHHVFFVNFYR